MVSSALMTDNRGGGDVAVAAWVLRSPRML